MSVFIKNCGLAPCTVRAFHDVDVVARSAFAHSHSVIVIMFEIFLKFYTGLTLFNTSNMVLKNALIKVGLPSK